MARKPKCKFCNKEIDKSNPEVVRMNNRYYCSIKECKQDNAAYFEQKEIYELIFQISQIERSSLLNKELNNLYKRFTNTAIIEYLRNEGETLRNIINNKSFTNEFGKVRYFMSVLRNNLPYYTQPKSEVKRQADTEVYDIKYKPSQKRKSLSDYLDEE